jgi:hypothetical protein
MVGHLALEGGLHGVHHDVIDDACARDGERGLGLKGMKMNMTCGPCT